MTKFSLLAFALTALVACSSSGTAHDPDGASTTPVEASGDPVALVAKADASRGRTVFEQGGCNGCHGGMMSTGGGPSLVGITWDDDEISEAFTIIDKGDGKMPAFGDRLSHGQIADVIAYLKTLKK